MRIPLLLAVVTLSVISDSYARESCKKELNRLDKKIAVLGIDLKKCKANRPNVTALQNEINEAQNVATILRSNLTLCEQLATDLQTNMSRSDLDNIDLENDLKREKNITSSISSDVRQVKAQLAECQTRLEKCKETKEMPVDCQDNNEKVDDCIRQSLETERELNESKTQANKFNRNFNKCEENLKIEKKKLSKAAGQLKIVQKQQNQTRSSLSESNRKYSKLRNLTLSQNRQIDEITSRLEATESQNDELTKQLRNANDAIQRCKDDLKEGRQNPDDRKPKIDRPTDPFELRFGQPPTEAMLLEAGRKSNNVPTELCDAMGRWWWQLENGQEFDVDTAEPASNGSVLEAFTKLKRGENGLIRWPDVILPASLGGAKLISNFGKYKGDRDVMVWFTVRNDDYNTDTIKVEFPLRFRVDLQFYLPEVRKPIGAVLTKEMTLTEIGYAASDSIFRVSGTLLDQLSQPPVIHVIFSSL